MCLCLFWAEILLAFRVKPKRFLAQARVNAIQFEKENYRDLQQSRFHLLAFLQVHLVI